MITGVWINADATALVVELGDGDDGLMMLDTADDPVTEIKLSSMGEVAESGPWRRLIREDHAGGDDE